MSLVKYPLAACVARPDDEAGRRYPLVEHLEAVAWAMGRPDGTHAQKLQFLAGLLHDVGKIGVRDGILLKRGHLTADEMAEVRMHPARGARIAEAAGFPLAVVEAIRHHHEDYGGGGYPAGLSGDAIPLLARIIRVADAYDAMTSDRPYRRAFSPARARAELRRYAGRRFDPEVVEVFLRIPVEEGAEIAAVRESGDALAGTGLLELA